MDETFSAAAFLKETSALLARLDCGAIERARAASASASTLLAMDDRLRNMAGRVRIPYWERRATVALEPGGASVSYYEGEEPSRLGIVLRGKSLTLSASGDEHSFSPIDEPRVALLKTAAGELSGISLEFSLRGKRYLIAAPFGATPFGVTPFGEASLTCGASTPEG